MVSNTTKKNQRLFLYILILFGILLISIAFVWFARLQDKPEANQPETINQTVPITYRGGDDKTPLELLRQYSKDITTTEVGDSELVTSINGVYAPSGKIWAFKVNGKSVDQAANKYKTNKDHTIEWVIENQ